MSEPPDDEAEQNDYEDEKERREAIREGMRPTDYAGRLFSATEADVREAETERPEGMLTTNQREYLIDPEYNPTEAQERQLQKRMRKRIRNAILDFSLLVRHIDDGEFQTLCRPHKGEQSGEGFERKIDGGMQSMIAFAYTASKQLAGVEFETFLLPAVRSTELRGGWLVSPLWILGPRSPAHTSIDDLPRRDELPHRRDPTVEDWRAVMEELRDGDDGTDPDPGEEGENV